tara:strand:+ start:284 stop:574 length:291 start_codon:yes stop_codon:yes gene_type:complete
MKWIILFYQVVVSLPDGEILFSGLQNGNESIKVESDFSDYYRTKDECEKKLIKFKGQNNLLEVSSFNNKRVKLVTDNFPLINEKRVVINAFQCLKI